ncbi:glycosyltransferase [Roseiconus lacunae]|uniref:Glycosyltransferase n=1 Tax=Roseiconus lacunae TaxID=2605694 RepID=A0ABT7PEG2_9BACT|nr:glycosyltransferase [Roseiconus lacunae]MDM4014893.1 glycosyltransferase [Roseiconus lacunae]
MIGRHFWPLGAFDAAGHLMQLATMLSATEFQVDVVTPRQANVWSERFQFREFNVHRPIRMFRTGWSSRGDRSISKYIKSLKEWICENRCSPDLIYCDQAREESIAVVEAAKQLGIPSVVRIAGNGSASDLFETKGRRNVKRCLQAAVRADAVVVNSGSVQRQLIIDGFDGAPTCRIPIGVVRGAEASSNLKSDLRGAMAKINGDLHVFDTGVVVLSVERMSDQSGLMTLVESARVLSERLPNLCYWFIGDGPKRDSIYSYLKGEGLRQMMAMPGSFGLLSDVFQAADLMVHAGDDGFQNQVPLAITHRLPLVIANGETAREFFAVSQQEVQEQIASGQFETGIYWFDPARPRTLRIAIETITQDLDRAEAKATELRRTMQTVRDASASLEQYARLFRRLIDAKRNDVNDLP